MKAYLTTHLTVAFHALIVVSVILFSAWYVDNSREHIEREVMNRISTTENHIIELATITDRNGADALTERIITDCPRRAEFETLLNALNTANKRELLSAQQLFESCGSFFAERKAFMVAELSREYTLLVSDLELLRMLRDLTPQELALKDWNALIALETERSSFLTEQTTIQAEIIKLLIEGGNTTRIQELVRQAQDVSQSLTITDTQIDLLRGKLTE